MSHIERMQKEQADLKGNIEKLETFIFQDEGIFDGLRKDEKVRMSQQLAAMNLYLGILEARIEAQM